MLLELSVKVGLLLLIAVVLVLALISTGDWLDQWGKGDDERP